MFDRINKGLWWDRALTLVEGCTPVSPGCDHCWSASLSHRFKNKGQPENHYHALTNTKGKWTGKIICREDRFPLPLKVKKPTVWAVWNDFFHEDVPFAFQINTLVMMRECPWHVFIILTKRAERAKYFFDLLYRGQFAPKEPLHNVWLGVTAESQEQAEKRIPILLQIPAAVHFVSCEPLLGPVNLRPGLPKKSKLLLSIGTKNSKAIDWVVCGCESGHHRRPTEWPWIESLRNQCQSARVPFFLKQSELGGKVVKAPYPEYLELPRYERLG